MELSKFLKTLMLIMMTHLTQSSFIIARDIFASFLTQPAQNINEMITMKPTKHQVTFKEVTAENLPLLFQWFKQSYVQQWWPTPQKDEFFANFLQRIRSKDTRPYLVFIDNKPIGYIQYYHIDRSLEKSGAWLPELPEATVGTDQFIGDPDYLGKGYGTLFIKEFIKYLTNTLEPHITTIIVDPDPSNQAAIRCYEKVGFIVVGTFTTPHGLILLMRYDV
ncbi:GNAT family N-acetyltransferase [Candidatus Dependentiae bacterium]|nr:GNAT family N-acetyltransferase [Candidatus Dependentiae bacterium]